MGNFVGIYHNKLDKKYFHKSVYIKKWEEAFNVKIKDYPLQYELVYETYNTLIEFNNILFSKNYIAKNKKVDKILDLLNNYLNTYKNKIQKSFDSECILIYESFEEKIEELTEMKELYITKNIKYNLTKFEKDMAEFMYLLDGLGFDKLVDSKGMPFIKKPNEKLPKKVNLKLLNDLERHIATMFSIEKQEQLNDNFVKNYSKRKFDLQKDDEQKYFIIDVLTRVKDINNAIVDYYIYDNDKTVVDIFNSDLKHFIDIVDISFVKDIEYVNVFNRLKEVSKFIDDDKIDLAFSIIKEIIKLYDNLFERMS